MSKDKEENVILSIESDDEDEIFQLRKRFISQFKSKSWSKQMFTIQWYLDTGMYPFYYCGSGN